MLIIGERINSTRQRIQDAIRARNDALIAHEARAQIDAGAHYIDVNCAIGSGDELQDIDWVVSVIQSSVKRFNICIDSPNYLAIERALKVYKGGGEILINSITGEEARIKTILPLAKKYKAKVIALTMTEEGMPHSAQDRLDVVKKILARAEKDGFDPNDLFFDALIRPISTEPEQAREFLAAIPMIKGLGPAKTVCGLSNVSFGLPSRSVLNAAFLTMAIQAGLDAAIIDPLDKRLISSAKAAQALLGQDEYCAGFIRAFREGKLI